MPFRSSGRGAYGPQGQRVLKGPLAPVWVTGAGQVGTANLGAAVSVQLSATDDSGDAPTYTIASGSLPTGLSLSSSGLISGTLGGSAGTFTFTVNATDVNGRATTSGSFTFLSVQPGWSALTITTSSTGESGPTSTAQVSMSATGSAPVYSLDSGFIDLTIPITGTYRIETWGAKGGGSNSDSGRGGNGARMRGDFSLTAGNVLKIVVGQRGVTGTGGCDNTRGGGGGGGTFVALGNNRGTNTLLIAAGGGAGTPGGTASAGTGQTANNGEAGSGTSGGTGGGGGSTPSGTPVHSSASGGGFTGNGASTGNAGGGIAYRNGANGGGSSGCNGVAPGGFGAGGGAQLEGGGGGGYSGGGGSTHGWGTAGGGGSFNNGTNQSNTGNAHGGAGQVTLTRL
jgi:hypothetical protein